MSKHCYSFFLYALGLFGDLERSNGGKIKYESLGIESYGISMTTLEEVFLKLGKFFSFVCMRVCVFQNKTLIDQINST